MNDSYVINKTAEKYRILDRDIVFDATKEYVLRVSDMPTHDKPREKLMAAGPKNLNLSELVAILFGVGTRKEEVMNMSKRVVREYGERAIMHESDPRKLAKSLDIPISKASQIVVAFELGRRFFATKSGKPVFIRNASQAYEHLKGMAHSQKEQLRGLYLNSRHELIHEEVISVGTLTSNIVHPREVFQPAIIHSAAAVIIAHNHPSGDPEPTPPDLHVTEQLQNAGDALGIGLLDHLVITAEEYVSILLQEHKL